MIKIRKEIVDLSFVDKTGKYYVVEPGQWLRVWAVMPGVNVEVVISCERIK